MESNTIGVLDDQINEAKSRLAALIQEFPDGDMRYLSEKSMISITQLRRYAKESGEPALGSLISLQAALGRNAIEVRINTPERAYAKTGGVEVVPDSASLSFSSDAGAEYRNVALVSMRSCENPDVIKDAPKFKIDNRILALDGIGKHCKLIKLIPEVDVLAPTINARDVILVDLSVNIPVDGILLLYSAGDYMLRRVQNHIDGRIRISTDNNFYDDIVIDPAEIDFRVVGAVVSVEKKLR